MVVFNHKSEIVNNLRFNVQTWLNITDNTDFFGAIESIVDKEMNLTPVDMKRLADRIVLDEDYIVEEFSDIKFLNDTWNDSTALQQFSDSCEGIVEFPDEPDPFVADQKGELDLNPEQEEITEAPSLLEHEVSSEPILDEAVPCETVPPMIGNYISLIQQAVLPGISYCIYDCTVSVPHVSFDIGEKYLIKVLTDPQDRTAKDLSKDLLRMHRGELDELVHVGPDGFHAALHCRDGEALTLKADALPINGAELAEVSSPDFDERRSPQEKAESIANVMMIACVFFISLQK